MQHVCYDCYDCMQLEKFGTAHEDLSAETHPTHVSLSLRATEHATRTVANNSSQQPPYEADTHTSSVWRHTTHDSAALFNQINLQWPPQECFNVP
jgi:hypothetical protein